MPGRFLPRRRRSPRRQAGKEAELALYNHLGLLGVSFNPQYSWGATLTPARKYVADAAVPPLKLLIEVEGRAHIAGIEKFETDQERRNLAMMAGWRILSFTPKQAKDGSAALIVQAFVLREGRG